MAFSVYRLLRTRHSRRRYRGLLVGFAGVFFLARKPTHPLCKSPPDVKAFLPPQVLLPCRYFASSGCAPKSVGTRELSSCWARRLATSGLQLAEAMMTRIPTPAVRGASSSYHPVRAKTVRKFPKCCQLFRVFRGRALFARGVMYPYFHWAGRGRGRQ